MNGNSIKATMPAARMSHPIACPHALVYAQACFQLPNVSNPASGTTDSMQAM